MDAAGALSELGLTVPTSAEAIRRAYLRNVRAHPPERDPEGFRRVRDAYELLKDAPWLWTEFSLPEPDDGDFEQSVALAVEAARQRSDEFRSDESAPPAPEPPLDVAEQAEDGEKPSEDERTSPPEPFFEHEPDEESDPLEQAMASGDFERAAEALLEALADGGEGDGFAAWQVEDVLLRLYAQGKFKLGERLLTSFDDWIERRQLLPSAFGSVAAARLALLRELRRLPGVVPARVVTSLAKSIEDGQFLSATGALEQAFLSDDGFDDRFKRHAPLLHAAAMRYASVWMKGPKTQTTWQGLRYVPVWRFVGLGIFLFFLHGTRTCTSELARPSSNGTRATNVEKARVPSVASAEAALEAWHATTAAELDESLRAGDCARVREKWHMFLVTAKSRTNESGLGERRAAIVAKCPELEGVLR